MECEFFDPTGSLQQAFIARVAHLSEEKTLDLRVLHGDGTNTVAQKGAMASGILAPNTRRASKYYNSFQNLCVGVS